MEKFPEPLEGSVFYEDEKTYACLAFHPVVEGHSIVVWREDVKDLNDLGLEEALHLMGVVYKVRKALLAAHNTDKVYMAYLDEVCHVHVHLFPRQKDGKKGFDSMTQPHGALKDLSKVPYLRSSLLSA